MYKSEFINEINSRGFIHQSSDIESIDQIMSKQFITAYIGFDPTSDDLHVGSLLQLMLLNWLEYYGHKPILLMGGGTALIGDPSGKDALRKFLTIDKIKKNILSIKSSLKYFLDFKKNAKILNNYEWLSSQNYIDFLRKVGAKVTINKMLTYDSVKLRLDREQPLTFLEFNYMLLQAYDFLHLYKNYNCILQLGGSDQWGNIINGIELIRKTLNKPSFAITSPLITNADGTKMGKTKDGAIWINKKKLSNFDFFQYWRNTKDHNVGNYLKLFTKIEMNEIKKLSELKGKEINESKKILAYEITKICRGKNAANQALKSSSKIFENNTIDEKINTKIISKNKIIKDQINLVDIIETLSLVKSRSEAKRVIKSGGVKINDIKINQLNNSLKEFAKKNEIKISVGKKKIGFIKLS
ncbi:MAG: Tyrosine--tRNA ligase 1 [Alphaproteobacteria bacterium MarineAlpha5_Bin9]|nr:MAG: Tyrosine--tRNA ligase 1 [Alphaproteobacteria bacterium MarineAlpha5_Bin9]|tara:strand:- start:1490 stop:2725 length:1236 start_codon:yes stop_codon:yes gene_type:complete